jgi:phosphoesterase RecJ-like protein
MIYTSPTSGAPALAEAFAQAQRILLLTHVHPDGDAISSLLAFWHMLHDHGKTPIALASPDPPGYVRVLPGFEHVQFYSPGMPLPEADLVCMVDAANIDRVGQIYEDHAEELQTRPLVIVDHHVTNNGAGKVNVIVPDAASCADLVCRLFQVMNITITPDIATCLLLGIMTDTQSFQTSATNPAVLQAAADLLEAGGAYQAIVNAVYKSLPFSTIALIGLALAQVQREGAVMWTTITREMMDRVGAEDSAYDDLLMLMQRTAGIQIYAMLKEQRNGETKVSLRSTPAINVAVIAQEWGGGGHAQAAGATLHMPLSAAEGEVLPRLQATVAELEAKNDE